ncbi:MAG: HAMP domain-containing histidine kinase [Tissierellales bacterium]|nr:HAMP domain-containing histidine kinase [Tissierellales bacterium]MBN2827168.1 HAMP domain-containing histidine kinase [Tissierellales bacterium]
MKTISQKISSSFLPLIIVIMLIVVILFNLSMRVYMQNVAKKELRNSIETAQSLMLPLLSSENNQWLSEQNTVERLILISRALKISSHSSETDFIIVDSRWQTRFPKEFSGGVLNDQIVQEAIDTLKIGVAGQVYSFRVNRSRYYTIEKPLLTNRMSRFSIIFIVAANQLSGMVRAVNLILLGIMLFAVLIAMFVAVKLSKSIAKPISDLSEHAKEIGRGHIALLDSNDSTLEIHELTKNMNEMSKKLIDQSRAQEMFLQNASHEIRTPLMSIQGYAEGIVNGVFADISHPTSIICEESKRLNALVEELLTLSRIESHTYEKELKVYNLTDMIKEYLQKIRGYAIKENKELILSVNEDRIEVKVSDALLSAVVINIVSNAIKYAHSYAEVSLFTKGNSAVIKIRDDGSGIDEKDLPHIFERFYKGKKGHFGLGLSIAKSAVTSMGGEITVYNNQGAVFEISLPLVLRQPK